MIIINVVHQLNVIVIWILKRIGVSLLVKS
jgi:hypothetical protein